MCSPELAEEMKEQGPTRLVNDKGEYSRSISATAALKGDDSIVSAKSERRLGFRQCDLIASKKRQESSSQVRSPNRDNNNNDSYVSSVGDSNDSSSNVFGRPAGAYSDKNSAHTAHKSAIRTDGLHGPSPIVRAPSIEATMVPTPDHEVKGAYLLENYKLPFQSGPTETELAHSQTGSEGGLTLGLPVQAPHKEQILGSRRPQKESWQP